MIRSAETIIETSIIRNTAQRDEAAHSLDVASSPLKAVGNLQVAIMGAPKREHGQPWMKVFSEEIKSIL